MKESIVELIGNELIDLFPNIPIYRENRTGGFEEPSFFIQKVDAGVKPGLFKVQNRKYSYQLIYFPKVDEPKRDMELMEEILLSNFTDLSNYATLKNRNFNQSEDNTLQLTFEILIRAHSIDQTPKQEQMNFKGGIVNGN